MKTDYAFWNEQEAEFQKLCRQAEFSVVFWDNTWEVRCEGPHDESHLEELVQQFRSTARHVGIMTGISYRVNGLHAWLKLLFESKNLSWHTNEEVIVQKAGLESAKYCKELSRRSYEYPLAVNDNPPRTRLRRDVHPSDHSHFYGSLYDHDKEPFADPNGELSFWKDRALEMYAKDIDMAGCVTVGAVHTKSQALIEAISQLSYDLAVLHGNYILDCELRGEKAILAFDNEVFELIKTVTKLQQDGARRLAVSRDSRIDRESALKIPFLRIRRELERLLPNLPAVNIGLKRHAYRPDVDQYKERHMLETDKEAAIKLGVSIDVLKSIMSGKNALRCSRGTFSEVVSKLSK